VANAHGWGSEALIFSDGAVAYSALFISQLPSFKGIASYFASEILFYNLMMISGVKEDSGWLTVDSQGRVRSARWNDWDVLLRKRA
jgi:hypothetical protein